MAWKRLKLWLVCLVAACVGGVFGASGGIPFDALDRRSSPVGLAGLGDGLRQGYRFELIVSPTHPEFMWMAVANPVVPGTTGQRYFVTNHEGVTYFSTEGPFELNPDCRIPPGATPVGK